MAAFNAFPDLPGPDDTAFCVVNGVYCCANSKFGNISTFTNTTKGYPVINVSRDSHQSRASDEGTSMYLDVEDTLLKKVTSVWYEQGFLDALRVAADTTINRESPALAFLAGYALKLADTFTNIRNFMQPHLKDIGPKIIAKYSRTRNWARSPVRCVAWHPHATKLAVAAGDDAVRVHCADAAHAHAATLRCGAQGHVSALSWRPLCAAELAVGCAQGIVLWTVDPNSLFTKPSSNNAQVLRRVGHSPVTDVSWSPRGDVLVSCSGADAAMLVWDVALQTAVPLRRVAGGGVVLARWSLDATKLLSASSSIIFRLWEAGGWSAERWCARGGRVLAACWGPQDVLLFVAEGEPIVYALNTMNNLFPGERTNKAQPVLDVSKLELSNGDTVGGPVLDMCWDPSGRHLALLFQESPFVAVFNTANLMLRLQITPCCLVSGSGEELPNTIAFQQNFSDGACLTIGWSSGRLQYFPIVYTESF